MFITKKYFEIKLQEIRNEIYRNADWMRIEVIRKENEQLKEKIKELTKC